MRMRIWIALLLPLIAGTTSAQEKPDFTGQWVLVDPSASTSTIASELTVRQSIVPPSPGRGAFKIMIVERRLPSGVSSESYEIGGARVSGMIGGIPSPDGLIMQTRLSIKWDGDRLVIETGSYSGPLRYSGPFTEHGEVWSLDPQGRLVMTVTDRGSGTEPRTTQLTYRKR